MHEKYIGFRQKVGEFQCGAVPPLSLLSCPPHLDGKDDFTRFLHHKKRIYFLQRIWRYVQLCIPVNPFLLGRQANLDF